MNIQPYIGFDNIKFGLTKEQVVDELGANYVQDTEEHEDGSKEFTLFYDEFGIGLTFFSDDDNLLSTITFYSPEFTIADKEIIGIPEADFLALAKNHIADLTLEDDFEDINSKDYFSDKMSASFWIQDGIVDSISIFPEYEEDGVTVVWP